MNEALRNSIWNVFDTEILCSPSFKIAEFSNALWGGYWKKPLDSIPIQTNWEGSTNWSKVFAAIRSHFFACQWNEVYDFIEFIARFAKGAYGLRHFPGALNPVLEREMSGYRLVSGQITDITSQQEIEMLEEAMSDSKYSGVAQHLQRSLQLLADRKNPDYRNSIKESISAVEAMAKIITGKSGSTLGDALRVLEKGGHLNSRLKEGFERLYAYTNDKNGIRHAMMEEQGISAAEARFFLLSCTSFVNYLKSKS
jgi:hypothetical protein